MSNARNLANLLGTSTQVKTAKVADEVFQANESLIINGDMTISQRGSSFTAPSSQAYTLDRWQVLGSHDGAVDVSQSTTAPPDFKNSLKLNVTTADTSLASTQYYLVAHRIEGQNLAHLNYGSSDAKQVTISFWVRSSKTGTYHVEIQTSGSQELARQYTIDAANTWEYKTLTWIANTDHTIPEDNTLGLLVYWWLAAGDTFDGSPIATTWANNTNRVSGQTNFLDTISNEFYLTGCKMEVGSVATPFRHESIAENLAKCHRYYYRIPAGNTYQRFGTGQNSSTTLCRMTPIFPVEMRVTPTIDTTGTAANYGVYEAGSVKTCTAIPVLSNTQSTNKMAEVYFTTNSLTAGRGAACLANNNNAVYLGYDAEL